MEIGSLMKTHTYHGEDFAVMLSTEHWRIGLLRSSARFRKTGIWERHMKTVEVHILLSGQATIYVKDESGVESSQVMTQGTVYEVAPGEWHHVTVSDDAVILVVEDADTSKENSEKSLNYYD